LSALRAIVELPVAVPVVLAVVSVAVPVVPVVLAVVSVDVPVVVPVVLAVVSVVVVPVVPVVLAVVSVVVPVVLAVVGPHVTPVPVNVEVCASAGPASSAAAATVIRSFFIVPILRLGIR